MISRHYPELIETKKGHMKGERQGIQSTKEKPKANIADNGIRTKIKEETNAPPEIPHTKENDVYFRKMDMLETMCWAFIADSGYSRRLAN